MKHGILQTKTAKRGARRLLCLLLALMMTAGDALKLFPPVETNAANSGMVTTDRMLYKWKRVKKGTELREKTSKGSKWVPVLIGYKSNGTEYLLDTSTIAKNKDGKYVDSRKPDEKRDTILTSNYEIKAANWTSKASTNGYPSLCDSDREFWTLDDPLSDIAVYGLGDDDKDVWTNYFYTFLIGRNVDWGTIDLSEEKRLEKITKEKAASQVLISGVGNDIDFTEIGSDFYKQGEEWRWDSFRNWTIVGKDEKAPNIKESKQPATGLDDGKLRILAQHYNASDSCMIYKGDTVYSDDFSSYNYHPEGEFCIWKGERTKIATLTSNFKIEQGVTNLDSEMLIEEGVTLTIEPGAALTIDTTLYNNGTIVNYGTIFLLEGGCIRTLNPMDKESGTASQNCGKIICSGEDNNGEGNLIAFQNSSIIFDEGANLFKVQNGATVELNGTMVCPNTFTLDNADIYIREKGMLISQYAITDRFTQIKNMTISKEASHDGKLGYTYPAMKEINKSKVTQPYITTGTCKFTNEGYFAHLTDPTSKAAVERTEKEKQIHEKYFKEPVWTESILDYGTADPNQFDKYGRHNYMYGSYDYHTVVQWRGQNYNQIIYWNIPDTYYRRDYSYDNPTNAYYTVADFLNVDKEGKVYNRPDEQYSKSYRSEIVMMHYTTTYRYEAYYMLDSSGWYTDCIIGTQDDIGKYPWLTARTYSADAPAMVGWSVRRLWDGNKEHPNLIKEGHYDPASDTFITYNYQTMLKYIEFPDGSKEVYRFSGTPGKEVDETKMLAGERGTAYVNLRDTALEP